MVAGVVGDGWQHVGVFRRSDRHQVVRGGGGGWSMCRSCSGHQRRSNRCHLGATTGAGSPGSGGGADGFSGGVVS